EAKAALERAIVKVATLRAEEEQDPPLPLAVENLLSAAEKDCARLKFKYAVIFPSTDSNPEATPSTKEGIAEMLRSIVKIEADYPKALVETLVDYNSRHLNSAVTETVPVLSGLIEYITDVLENTDVPEPEATSPRSEAASPRSPREPHDGEEEGETPDAAAAAVEEEAELPLSLSQQFLAGMPVTVLTSLAKEMYRLKLPSLFAIVLSYCNDFFKSRNEHSMEVAFALNNNLPPPPSNEKTNLKNVVTNATTYEAIDADTIKVIETEIELLRTLDELERWKPKVEPPPEEAKEGEEGAGQEDEPPEVLRPDLLSTQVLLDNPEPELTILELSDISLPMELYINVVDVLDRCAKQRGTGPVLKQRPDFLTDAILRIFNPYTAQLIKTIEETGDSGELNPTILKTAVKALLVINSLMVSLDVDDVLLRAEVGLRLSLLLADFVEDERRAISVLRSTLAFVETRRAELIDPSLHQPVYSDDTAALTRASITTDVDDLSAMQGRERLGAFAYAGQGVFGAGSQLDPTNLAIASIHADLFITACRVELKLGRDVTESHGVHVEKLKLKRKKEKLAASKVAQQDAKKKPQKKASAGGLATTANSVNTTNVGGASGTMTATNTMAGTLGVTAAGQIIDASVSYCQFTESVLLTECKKNCYQRALLQIEMSTSRRDVDVAEMEALLEDAKGLLEEAKMKEDGLLASVADMQEDSYSKPVRGRCPPNPSVLSRSHNSITVAVRPFELVGPKHSKLPAIHHIKLFGKPSGAGTDVSLNNVDFSGTGVSVPFDPKSKTAPPITVTGLPTNDSYVFAIAAFDENDDIIGTVGKMCDPVETLNPFPLPLLWGYLAQRSLELGCLNVATDASAVVVNGVLHRLAEGHHSDLKRGWEAKPANGISMRPSIVDRMPDAVVQTFVKAVCIWVDSREPPDGSIGGQVETLKTIKIMQLAAAAAAIADDAQLVKAVVWRGYHLMLPVFGLDSIDPYTIQALFLLQQVMLVVPKEKWDTSMHSVFACLSYQIGKGGSGLAEIEAVKVALFGSNGTTDKEVEEGKEVSDESAEADDDAIISYTTAEQKSLFDVWQDFRAFSSLPDASFIDAVSIPPPVPPQPELDEEGNEIKTSEDTKLDRMGEFRINRDVGSKLSEDPGAAMELLNDTFGVYHEKYLKFWCMVCKQAIQAGSIDVVSGWIRNIWVKRSGASELVLSVLEKESTGWPEYVRENEAINDEENEEVEAPPSPSKTKKMGSSLAMTGGSLGGNEEGEESGPESTTPGPDDKEMLMNLGDIEAYKAFIDLNDALLFGKDYLDDERSKETGINGLLSAAKAAGLTAVVVSLSPSFADGVATDLAIEIEDVDMQQDKDEQEALLDTDLVERREVLLQRAEEGVVPGDDEEEEDPVPFVLDNRICAIQAVRSAMFRFGSAAWRSRCARAWTKLSYHCMHMFNLATCANMTPHLFSRDVISDREIRLSAEPWNNCSSYLLDMLEILGMSHQKDEEEEEDNAGGPGMGLTGTLAPVGLGFHDDNGIDTHAIDVDWICQYVIYSLKALCCARQWQALVDLGRRLNRVTNNRAAKESFPLIIFAQQRLVVRATRKFESRVADRDKFVREFEEEQAKKPKRRYRVASKVEKTDEERAFDKGRIKLENKVSDARGELRIHEQRLVDIQGEDENVKKALSGAVEGLRAGRHAMMKFIHVKDDPSVDNESAIRGILTSYNRTIALLRDKRETESLVEALGDVGDFMMTLGRVEEANKSWCDGIDALFNTLDAYKHWREVLTGLGGEKTEGINHAKIVEELGPEMCLVGGVLLGKLAKFCCKDDEDRRLEHCLMAAELFRAPFSLGLPHPQRLCDFASYQASQFLIGRNLFCDERKLDCSTLCMSLAEVAEVLVQNSLPALALPSICLREYLCRYKNFSIDGLVKARLQKVEACVDAGFVADGLSALAGVITGSGLPRVLGGYAGEIKGAGGDSDEDTREGLNFYGMKEFKNSLSVHDEGNRGAISWLLGRSGGEEETEEGAGVVFGLGAGEAGVNSEVKDLYGEEVIEKLVIARVKCILKLSENPKLPVIATAEDGGVAEEVNFEGLYEEMVKTARGMSASLLSKVMKKIARSAERGSGGGEEMGEEKKDGEEGVRSGLATVEDIRKAVCCITFKAQMEVRARKYKSARKLASSCLALMTRCSEGGMDLRDDIVIGGGNENVIKVGIDSKQWLECRHILASCALFQGRLEDCRDICEAGCSEGREVREGVWTRRLKLLAVHSAVQMGWAEAEGEVKLLCGEYMEADSRRFGYVNALLAYVGILEQKALQLPALSAADVFTEVRKMLVDAESIVIGMAGEGGWIGNCPLTYSDVRTNEMGATVMAPLSTALAEREFGEGFTAKVDVGDEVCPTPLSNLYLESVRHLAYLRYRVSKAYSDAVPKAIAVDVNSLGEDFEMMLEEDKEDLMKVSLRKAELGLSTLRHVGVVHPSVRGGILLQVGLGRMWMALKGSGSLGDAREALEGALTVFWESGGFDRPMMRSACLHLVNLYGNIGGGGEEQLKVAIHWLMKAASLAGLDKKLKCDVDGLVGAMDMTGIAEDVGDCVRQEIGDGVVEGRGLICWFLSALRERDFVPCNDGLASEVVKVHSALWKRVGGYREEVCCGREELMLKTEDVEVEVEGGEEGETRVEKSVSVEVKNSLVCAQWYDADGDDLVLDDTQSSGESELHPYVNLMMVVGCGESEDGGGGGKGGKGGKDKKVKKGAEEETEGVDVVKKMAEKFGEEVGPLLICQAEVRVKSKEVAAMKDRASEMRSRLEMFHQLKGSDGVNPPEGLSVSFVKFIKDMLELMGRGAPGGEGEVLDGDGDMLVLPLNVESLVLLEGFFDLEGGCCSQSVEYAYMLRDAFFKKE
ncbi:hypothetical protein TrRE_jg12197, partial [Triparma retinervis]